MERIYDMIIVGGGPGGYTAALYGARAGLKVLVIEKLSAGGQMALSPMIDNYPGFDEGIDGFSLGQKMLAGAERFGAESLLAEVTELELNAPVKTVRTTEGNYQSRTVILSAGADPKNLGLPKEDALLGRGVSHCAACDGMFYRGKTVVVVGGGNTAAADALQLSRICKKVIIVHRRDTLRATKIYHQPLLNAENVEFYWNSTVTELLHDGRLTGVKVQNLLTGEEISVPADGLFVSIGRKPNSYLVQGQLELDEAGYIVADETTATSLPGVYAVGDVRTKNVRQIVTAAADGAVAAHYAEEHLVSLRQ
jgi:thioredoxin reductase (NADPH)